MKNKRIASLLIFIVLILILLFYIPTLGETDVEEINSFEECIAAGYTEQFAKGVVNMIRKNSFKRVVPPIAKLGNQELNEDFLSFGDWGR